MRAERRAAGALGGQTGLVQRWGVVFGSQQVTDDALPLTHLQHALCTLPTCPLPTAYHPECGQSAPAPARTPSVAVVPLRHDPPASPLPRSRGRAVRHRRLTVPLMLHAQCPSCSCSRSHFPAPAPSPTAPQLALRLSLRLLLRPARPAAACLRPALRCAAVWCGFLQLCARSPVGLVSLSPTHFWCLRLSLHPARPHT